MPISSGKYVAPTWNNGSSPAINAAELQAISDTVAKNQNQSGTITLTTTWLGNNPYYQTVVVSGATVTATKRVTLTPSPVQLKTLIDNGIALQTENDNGTVIVYAIGNVPASAMTIACSVSEVV